MSRPAVVVIGRNEGRRLKDCLDSLRAHDLPMVYVDSASEDGSPQLARSMGFDVLELDDSLPYTAARARNAGTQWLREHHAGIEFVQFVDGDCILADGWIERGLTELSARVDLAVVVGNVREHNREASIYNRLCDIEWRIPYGEVEGCGGVAMIRVAALQQVRGFDPSVIAAEDTELCARLRAGGWKILHVDAGMAYHDAAMLCVRQWWQRMVRAGYGFAQFSRPGNAPSKRFFAKAARGAWLWGLAVPLLTLALTWPTRGAALVLLGGYPLLWLRVYQRMRRRGLDHRDAALYGLHCVVGKFPQLAGMFRYYRDRLRRRQGHIIEHKHAESSAATAQP